MSLISLLLVFIPAPLGQGSCAEACYQQKSTAYQQCRSIPPAKRGERTQCFRQADDVLRRCLAACK